MDVYESSHDELYYAAAHWVEQDGSRISPKIKDFAFMNYGYVVTWSSVFWVEGFVLHNDKLHFVSIGEHSGYAYYTGSLHTVSDGSDTVSRTGLEAYLGEPITEGLEEEAKWRDFFKAQLLQANFYEIIQFCQDRSLHDKLHWDPETRILTLTET
jgi:hypothetical protein